MRQPPSSSTSPLDATTFSDRQWSSGVFLSFLVSMLATLPVLLMALPMLNEGWSSAWQVGAVAVAVGLSVGTLMAANARLSAEYGYPFISVSRAVFGWYGSLCVGAMRALVSLVVGGCMLWLDGRWVAVWLRSWGLSLGGANAQTASATAPAESSTLDALGLNFEIILCTSVAWLMLLLGGMFGRGGLTWLVVVNAVLMTTFLLGIGAYAVITVGTASLGPLFDGATAALPFPSLLKFLEVFVTLVPYAVAMATPYILNIGDYARHVRTPVSVRLCSYTGVPVFFTVYSLVGSLLVSIYFGQFGVSSNATAFDFVGLNVMAPESRSVLVLLNVLIPVLWFSSVVANLVLNLYPMSLLILNAFPGGRLSQRWSHVLSMLALLPVFLIYSMTSGAGETSSDLPELAWPVYQLAAAFVAPVLAVFMTHNSMFHDTIFPDQFSVDQPSAAPRWRAWLAWAVGAVLSASGMVVYWFVTRNDPSIDWSRGWSLGGTLEVAWIWQRLSPMAGMIVSSLVYRFMKHPPRKLVRGGDEGDAFDDQATRYERQADDADRSVHSASP